MATVLGLQIALIVFGLVVAFAGLWLWELTVTVLSFSLGAGAGYVYASPADPIGLVAMTLMGGFLGLMLIWGAIYFVIALPGFVIGAVIFAIYVAPHLETGQWVVVFIGGSIGATIALAVHEFMIIFTSALIGAISVSLGVKSGSLVAYVKQLLGEQALAQGVIHLPFLTDGGFLLVFLAGIAVQIGFNYFDDRFPFKQIKSRIGFGSTPTTGSETVGTDSGDAAEAMVVCQDCENVFASQDERPTARACPDCNSEETEAARYACHDCNTAFEFDSALRKLSGVYCPDCESDDITDSRNISEGD